MNKSNEEIDLMIKEALSKEEAQFYEQLDEEPIQQQFLGLYKGRMKYWAMLTTFMQLVFTGLFFYCAYMFFTVETNKEMIIWGISGLYIALSICMIKLFHWMQMNKNSILREIKKIELHLSVNRGKD